MEKSERKKDDVVNLKIFSSKEGTKSYDESFTRTRSHFINRRFSALDGAFINRSRVSTQACFLGNLPLGKKNEIKILCKILNINFSSSVNNYTSFVVVDDVNRTDLLGLKRAREQGILIMKVEEFLRLATLRNKEGFIK